MQFLYRRHPEVRMGVELPIKPCRSAFVRSDAHEIGLCRPRQRPLFFAIVADARVKWPSPIHLSIMLCPVPKTQECEFDLLTPSMTSVATARFAQCRSQVARAADRQNCFAWPPGVGLS